MSHPKFEIVLADESVLFGHYKVNSQFAPLEGMSPESIDFELVDLYHERPAEPDRNGVPVASMLTCLNAMIPAIHRCAWPFTELAQAIWAKVTDTQLRADVDDLDFKITQPARLLDGESDGN